MNIPASEASANIRHELEGLLSPETAKKHGFSGTLRAKGFLAFVAVAVYAVLLTTFTYYKKAELLVEFERLQQLHQIEDLLRQVDETAFHLVVSGFINSGHDNVEMGTQRFQTNFDMLKKKNNDLATRFPGSALKLDAIENMLKDALVSPSLTALIALNTELIKVKGDVAQRIDLSRHDQKIASDKYKAMWDSAAITLMSFGLFGLIVLGAFIGFFFTRLTDDLNTLKKRALDIVYGERVTQANIHRNDEVAELMQAVNYMAYALDEREKELVIARQRYFYQEKMAAVGALAAGVAHEIGNPIAAMSGVLQEMSNEQPIGEDGNMIKDERLETLKTQIRRLSGIIREISGFASPQSAERDLLDLNGLIRTDARLMAYDKRMQNVNLQVNLDPQLPAIYGVADQLTQVIMNLLINAADALESVSDHEKEIVVVSAVCGENVHFSVTDNGSGMSPETITRAFEAFYTTKKRGTGLGLALCYSIITEHGGNIEIDSTIGQGTKVQVVLPIDPRNSAHRQSEADWQAHHQVRPGCAPYPFPNQGS